MSDAALLAVAIAAAAGLFAGRAWTASRRRGERLGFRSSPHYTEGLHYLAAGQLDASIRELGKVLRDHPDALEVLQVQSHLYREVGKVERAIEIHRRLLSRRDLARAERAHALASLGTDYRRAGLLDRAAQAYADALEVDPRNLHALAGRQKLFEEQRQWREAYESQAQVMRLRKSDDGLVLGFLQAELGQEALRAGRREAAEKAFRTAVSLDRRVFPAHLALASLWAEEDPRRAQTSHSAHRSFSVAGLSPAPRDRCSLSRPRCAGDAIDAGSSILRGLPHDGGGRSRRAGGAPPQTARTNRELGRSGGRAAPGVRAADRPALASSRALSNVPTKHRPILD